jgi:hypothetical protein
VIQAANTLLVRYSEQSSTQRARVGEIWVELHLVDRGLDDLAYCFRGEDSATSFPDSDRPKFFELLLLANIIHRQYQSLSIILVFYHTTTATQADRR